MPAPKRGLAAGDVQGPPEPPPPLPTAAPPPTAANGGMPGTAGGVRPRAAKRQRSAASPPAGGSKKSGSRGGYTELGPGEHVLPGGGRILYEPNFVPPAAAAQLFAALKEQIQWQQRPVKVMGRTVMQPRLIAYQADGGELAVGAWPGPRSSAMLYLHTVLGCSCWLCIAGMLDV